MSDDEKKEEEAPLEPVEQYCDVHSAFYTTQCGACSDEAGIEFAEEVEGIPAGGIFDTPSGGATSPRDVVTAYTDEPRVRQAAAERARAASTKTSRDNAKRIDSLVRQVGYLHADREQTNTLLKELLKERLAEIDALAGVLQWLSK